MGALEKCKSMVIFVLHFFGSCCRSGRIYVRVYHISISTCLNKLIFIVFDLIDIVYCFFFTCSTGNHCAWRWEKYNILKCVSYSKYNKCYGQFFFGSVITIIWDSNPPETEIGFISPSVKENRYMLTNCTQSQY